MQRSISTKPTTYQSLLSRIRRFDRDSAIELLAKLSQRWTGEIKDNQGHVSPLLPWSISGIAVLFITRGTQGGSTATEAELEQLSFHFLHLEDSGTRSDKDYAIRLVGRIMHEQFPFQRLGIAQWARPVALYLDTPFKPGYQPEVMKSGWDKDLLDCSISDFVSVGFCLHTAANNGGRYPLNWTPDLQKSTKLHGGTAAFDRIVKKNFLTEISDVKSARKEALLSSAMSPGQRFRHEPFSYNPLTARPFVGGIVPNEWIAPSAPLVQMRSSPLGVIYAGLEKWGAAFTRDAGNLFEQYVGRQLNLVPKIALHSEINYGTKKLTRLSVDWIVELDHFNLLIECKNSIPNASIREGLNDFVEAHDRLAKGLEQINKTSDAILNGHEAFAHLPQKPLVGLVVTLGNFEVANTATIRAILPVTKIPTAIVSIDFLEKFVTLNSAGLQDLAGRLPSSIDATSTLDTSYWLSESSLNPNPIIEDAFAKVPIVSFASAPGLPVD